MFCKVLDVYRWSLWFSNTICVIEIQRNPYFIADFFFCRSLTKQTSWVKWLDYRISFVTLLIRWFPFSFQGLFFVLKYSFLFGLPMPLWTWFTDLSVAHDRFILQLTVSDSKNSKIRLDVIFKPYCSGDIFVVKKSSWHGIEWID